MRAGNSRKNLQCAGDRNQAETLKEKTMFEGTNLIRVVAAVLAVVVLAIIVIRRKKQPEE
jgi:hypothetical protein